MDKLRILNKDGKRASKYESDQTVWVTGGAADYLEVPGQECNLNGNEFTIDFWIKKGEKKMNKLIIENYDRTEDAVLVQKHFGSVLDENNPLTAILVRSHALEILEEAKRLEAEEIAKKESR